MCLFMCSRRVNFLPQISQGYGLSPVCERMCLFKMHWCMAEKLQYGHLNFFLITVNSFTATRSNTRIYLQLPGHFKTSPFILSGSSCFCFRQSNHGFMHLDYMHSIQPSKPTELANFHPFTDSAQFSELFRLTKSNSYTNYCTHLFYRD